MNPGKSTIKHESIILERANLVGGIHQSEASYAGGYLKHTNHLAGISTLLESIGLQMSREQSHRRSACRAQCPPALPTSSISARTTPLGPTLTLGRSNVSDVVPALRQRRTGSLQMQEYLSLPISHDVAGSTTAFNAACCQIGQDFWVNIWNFMLGRVRYCKSDQSDRRLYS